MNEKNSSSTPPVPSNNKLDPIAVLREELAAAALCHGVERVEDLTEELVRRYLQQLGESMSMSAMSGCGSASVWRRRYATALMDVMPLSCRAGSD